MEERLKAVHLSSDCYQVCMYHAFSTEREEIMGLLLGEVDEESRIGKMEAMMMLRRNDKRKDRVEISPEQLILASEYGERLSRQLNRKIRVMGWYHSHPHITVQPSAVDCRTQKSYQMMDQNFVGIIFSVFPAEGAKAEEQSLQVTCFQSDESNQRVEVPLFIVPAEPACYQLFTERQVQLPQILYEEERDQLKACPTPPGVLTATNNSAAFESSMYRMLLKVEAPLLECMQQRALILQCQAKMAEEIKEELEREHAELKRELQSYQTEDLQQDR